METAILPFIGAVSPLVPAILPGLAFFSLLTRGLVAHRWGKMAGLKFGLVTPTLAIIANILWVDWILSFLWGLLLILTLERIRRERVKPVQSSEK